MNGRSEISCFEGWAGLSHPLKPVRPLTPEQALQRRRFQRAHVLDGRLMLLETVENGPTGQTVISSFRYRYRLDGTLEHVTIVNPEGKTNELEY
ncbi:MAG: DUF6156 family protein [Myxococcota bacterium]